MSEPADFPASCLNCHTALAGPYCHQCGQKSRSIIRFLDEVVIEVLKNNFGYDSRLWRTIRLLFLRPGQLASEYVAGKRASFVSPIRLYLVTSVIFLLVQQMIFRPTAWFDSMRAGADMSGSEILVGAVAMFLRGAQGGSDLVMRSFFSSLTLLMLPILPIGALGLKGMYYKKRPLYMEHLIFLVYAQCVLFLTLLGFRMLPRGFLLLVMPEGSAIPPVIDWVLIILAWTLMYVHGLLAMKQFYGESWKSTILKHSCGSVLYLALSLLGLSAVLLWATRN